MEVIYEQMVELDHKIEIDREVDTISFEHQKELIDNKNIPPEIPTYHLPDNLFGEQMMRSLPKDYVYRHLFAEFMMNQIPDS